MNFRAILVLAAAGALCTAALGETLTFTPSVSNGSYYRWSDPNNWLTAGNANKKPATGDDLVIGVSIGSLRHAADCYGIYLASIRFKYGANYNSGISHNGFYLSEGGEGLVMEGGISSKILWAEIAMDGTVSLCISNDLAVSGATLRGKSASAKGRFVKLGPSTLTVPAFGDNMTGGTIREGVILLNGSGGKTGVDFHFDGDAASAFLTLGADIDLPDGALTSTADLPTTNHGVNGAGHTLTISGTPKVADMYYAGGFHGSASFRFAPSAANCSFTLARGVSTTTGKIAVSNAVLRVTDGASFTSLRALVAEAGGTLRFTAGTDFRHVGELRVLGGRVEVAENGVLEVWNVTTNGAVVKNGEYTSANCDWVGGGTVRVSKAIFYADPIYLDVPSGSTHYLPDAIDAYNAAHAADAGFTPISLASLNGGADKARTLVKTGAGNLYMTNDIRNFEGAVHIEEGVLQTHVQYSIGKESNDNAPVYVHSGATFSSTTTNKNMNTGRTFHVSGTGAAGLGGALQCPSVGISGSFELSNVFGSHVILDTDATVKIGRWVRASGDVKLNDHTLTIVGLSDESPFYLGKVVDDGQIVVKNAEWRISGTTPIALDGTAAGNRITFDSGGGFRFADASFSGFGGAGKSIWTLHFKGPTSRLYTDYNDQPRDSGYNRLMSKTILDTMVQLFYQSDRVRGYLYVMTPISGTGGFKTGSIRNNVFLHLLDPGSTFTGGIDFTHGTVWVYGNGTLPNGDGAGAVKLAPPAAPYVKTDGSSATVNFVNYFDGIAFMCPDTYELPELVANGAYPARVQCGEGAWRKVTVSNTGGMEYYSGLGAPLLDVQKGAVKLPRGAAPGLWEGTNVYANATAAQTAWEAADTSTNLVVRGPTSALQRGGFNYTKWLSNERMTYTGYIWNRSNSDVTWTFASSLKGPVTLKIDGTEVLSAAASELKAANVTLTPGPHPFEYRACNGSGPYAPSGWCDKFGFVYDTQGRNDTSTTNNFDMCVDTGDGALFTRYADPEGHLPLFDVMKFAKGTTLDVNGNAYVAATVTGWPVVTNTAVDASAAASFTITNAFVVDGATLSAGATMKVAMPLSFGETGRVCVTNLEGVAHASYTIATAAEPITFAGAAPLRSRLLADSRDWTVSRSPDGKSLTLEYSANTMIIFR